MGKELVDRDEVFSMDFELGPIVPNRILEADFSLLDQLHDGRRRSDDFGKGAQIKNGINHHGEFVRLEGAVAEGPTINDSAPVADKNHRSRRFAGPDGLFNDFRNGNKPFFPDFSRRGWAFLGWRGRGRARPPKNGKHEKKE
jgi:hypothetical protein